MIYEISESNDMLLGATLMVRIPEAELDRKALYTILEDKPDFIIPFRHRVVDGQIEFVYQIGMQSKLIYLTGERAPKEYAELWAGVLNPLLDCGDWFLKPYSFVLDIRYIYCDKNLNSVSYLYIPSNKDCSDYCSLKEMAAGVSRQMTVTDADMENKALRAIMIDFNPKVFIQMLKAHANDTTALISAAPPQYVYGQRVLPLPEHASSDCMDSFGLESAAHQPVECALDVSEEFIIDIPLDRNPDKKSKEAVKGNASPRKKKEKVTKIGSIGSAAKNKTESMRETPIGDVSHMPLPNSGITQPEFKYENSPAAYSIPTALHPDITQTLSYESSGAWLRLVGNTSLPPGIDVAIAEGEVFTVGRYDAAAGKQLSSFEFDKLTKAVSRRHAAIEFNSNGYSIIDLASSAGTFLNGQKLPPNTPCLLETGCRVSFGNCGADYVWEQ